MQCKAILLFQEIDPVTWNYVCQLESLTEETCNDFLEENSNPKFTYTSLSGKYQLLDLRMTISVRAVKSKLFN